MGIKINLDKKRASRLARHLFKEHPITRGKIIVNGKKLKGGKL